MGESVRALCLAEGLSTREAGLHELAVVEALNNVVEHAYQGRPAGRIDVSFAIDEAAAVAEVVDEGEPIDPAAAHALAGEGAGDIPREALEEGGRGLAIIRGIVDELTFAHTDGRNRVRMFTRRRRAE